MSARAIALVSQDKARWPLAGDQLFVDLDLSVDNVPPGTQLAIGVGGHRSDQRAAHRLRPVRRALRARRDEVRQLSGRPRSCSCAASTRASSSLARFGSATSHESSLSRAMSAWAADVSAGAPQPPPEVAAYYAAFAEEERLATGASRLEFERTKEMLSRLLPPPPARVVDVGGAAGVYSFWLADQGYDVHLVDASDAAGRGSAPAQREPAAADRLADGRRRAIAPAGRRVGGGGPRARPAVPPDGGGRSPGRAPRSVPRARAEGRRRRRGDLALRVGARRPGAEAEPRSALRRDSQSGSGDRPAPQHDRSDRLLHDRPTSIGPRTFARSWSGPASTRCRCWASRGWGNGCRTSTSGGRIRALRHDLMDVARRLEAEPSIVGASAHLLGIGRAETASRMNGDEARAA